jgi:hypothetical protein
MTPEQRTRLRRRLCLFGPLVAAIGGVVVSVSGLADFLEKVAPIGLRSYASQAMNSAPFGWLVLALGCAVGTSLDLARRNGFSGRLLGIWLCLVTPCVWGVQVIVCTSISVGGCILVGGIKGL